MARNSADSERGASAPYWQWNRGLTPPARLLGVLAILLAVPAAHAAVTFGDIIINVESEPKGNSTHGYFEYGISVTNRSSAKAHTVVLSLPRENYMMRQDYLREVRRGVQVGAGDTVRVALLQPDHPPIGGSGLVVTIDDRRQENEVPLRPTQTHRGGGYGYYGMGGYPSYSSGGGDPLVLMSGSIRKAFPPLPGRGPEPAGMGGWPPGGMPGIALPPEEMPGMPPGGVGPGGVPPAKLPRGVAPRRRGARFAPAMSSNTQFVPAEKPVEDWSANWLAYSRYDGIVVTADDLRTMPPTARTALWQYVETGGSLLVFGQAQLPKSWRQRTAPVAGFTIHEAGFGECLVSPDSNIEQWDAARMEVLRRSWHETAQPWQGRRSSYDANEQFPVVDNIGIPVRGLFVLMMLFTLAIGPINFIVLARRKRRIWLLWTTPVISLLTCLAVFGYMLISEGWQGHLRTQTLTILDESSRRATTIGWTAFYSPLTPGDGLHFSYDTEVVPQRMYDGTRAGVRSCTIDWSRDQHFAKGWVEARVPAHFKVRKSETRRERVTIHREADQTLSMVNGLGAEVRRFWYSDEKSQLYTASQVAPGARAVLTRKNEEIPAKTVETMRTVLIGPTNWLNSMQRFTDNPRRRLTPRSYLAELDDSPFVEDGLANAKTRRCRAVVLGILKESGEGE